MTKKMSKKIISVIMSVILVALCLTPAFAATKKVNPILVISGFSQYKFVDTASGKQVWTPEASILTDAITRALPPLATLLASDRKKADYDKFVDDAEGPLMDVLKYVAVNPDAEPANKNVKLIDQFTGPVSDYDYDWVKTVFENDIVDIVCNAVGRENVWVYGLDWRVDPLVLADEIHEYVENIKARTGCDKISISGISMGGIVMSCYLMKYGYEDLSNITYLSAAFTGLDYVGEMYSGKIKIDPDGLYNIINQSMHDTTVSDILQKTQILDMLMPVVDDLIKYESDRLFVEVLVPVVGYNTGMWSFVPAEYFESAVKYMGARMNEGSPEERAIFWGKVYDYHNNVQTKIGDFLRQAQADGVTVSVVSHYNMQMPPVSPASFRQGDQVIETRHTSGFATVSDLGKTLGDNYPVTAHVSIDRMIDANTAFLPNNTWFLKDAQHVGFSNKSSRDNGAFFGWILTQEGTDVYTDNRFPQFMQYFPTDYELHPIGDADGNFKLSVADVKLVLKSVSGLTTLTELQSRMSEINGDSKVTLVDARLILQSLAANA